MVCFSLFLTKCFRFGHKYRTKLTEIGVISQFCPIRRRLFFIANNCCAYFRADYCPSAIIQSHRAEHRAGLQTGAATFALLRCDLSRLDRDRSVCGSRRDMHLGKRSRLPIVCSTCPLFLRFSNSFAKQRTVRLRRTCRAQCSLARLMPARSDPQL